VILDPYLTVKEAAKYASLSVRTIRAMLARDTANALPCRRAGRRVLIKKSELDQYLDAYRVCGRPGVIAALREVGLSA
jgi:excisionase family DNA binding protein